MNEENERRKDLLLFIFFWSVFFFFYSISHLLLSCHPFFFSKVHVILLQRNANIHRHAYLHMHTHTHTPSDYVRWFISLCTFSSQIILFSCTSGVSCSPEVKLFQTFHSSEMWKPPFPVSQLCSYVDLVFGIFLTHRKAIFELRLDYTKMDCIH